MKALASALLALAAATHPAQTSMDGSEFWRSTSVTLPYAERFVSTKLCYSSPKYLFSCIVAVNSAGAFLDPPIRMTAADDVQTGDRVLRHYSALTLISQISAGNSAGASVHALFENRRRTRRHLREATAKHFATATNPTMRIDFESLLKRIVDALPSHVSPQMALGSAITGHLTVFDAHANVRPMAEVDELAKAAQKFVGIGITFRAYPGGALIEDVFPGSPAYIAGLRRGDLITHVISKPGDQAISVAGKNTETIGNAIDGAKDTFVELIVARDRTRLDLKIPRKPVDIPAVSHATIDIGRFHIGYFKIRSFLGSGVCEHLRRGLSQLESNQALGAILDLRDNPGGYISTAICVSSLFLGRQRVVGVKYVHVTLPGHTDDFRADADRPIDWREGYVTTPSKLPVVVLIDSQSASASEIVAGALQAYGRAWIVGERSYGKGSVQTTSPMDDNDTLDLTETTGRFYLPNGAGIEWMGIYPDFDVPYSKDAKSPLDLFALREEDDFPDGLPPEHRIPSEARPEKRIQLKACVEDGNRIETIMRDTSTIAAPEDFQRAYAIAVLECSASLTAAH